MPPFAVAAISLVPSPETEQANQLPVVVLEPKGDIRVQVMPAFMLVYRKYLAFPAISMLPSPEDPTHAETPLRTVVELALIAQLAPASVEVQILV